MTAWWVENRQLCEVITTDETRGILVALPLGGSRWIPWDQAAAAHAKDPENGFLAMEVKREV